MGDRWSVGAGVAENSIQNLARWITNPPAVKPGARMPGIRTEGGGMPPTGLSEGDVQAIAAYLYSLRSDAVPAAAPFPSGDSAAAPAGEGGIERGAPGAAPQESRDPVDTRSTPATPPAGGGAPTGAAHDGH